MQIKNVHKKVEGNPLHTIYILQLNAFPVFGLSGFMQLIEVENKHVSVSDSNYLIETSSLWNL